MANFYELLMEIMNDKNVSIVDLENEKILTKNTFYNFKDNFPSLDNIISIANHLQVSIDYIVGNCDTNKFYKYKKQQTNIYNVLNQILKTSKISQSKLCKDLGISRTNFSSWKNGSTPKFSTLFALSKYLKCNIDELLEKEKA